MRKLKLLLAAAILGTGQMWAQTDVTSTYLTNADFSQTTALTGNYLYGYGKDGSPYGFQTVDGWTSVVTKDAGDSYSGSGTAAGVFSYGSDTALKGNDKKAPSAGPDGNAGNCFGFFGVWGCGGYYYQNVTLAAGKYTITVPMYSQSGTQANTTYTGFFPTSGTNQTVAVNPTVGQWVNQTVTFSLAAETAGQIRIGYQSTGSGSGANPMLFIDCVKIEFTAIVVKDVLETAIAAATNANATLKNSDLTAAITTAQTVYDNADATQDEVNSAAATLNAATEQAMSAAGDVTSIFLTNPGFENCTETTTNAAAGGSAAPLDIAGGWTQTASASWSSSAVVAYGGAGQVNGASAPDADNAGNTGKTLGVSVGWGGAVTYQSAAVTLPAGVYTLQAYGYNALSGVTQFTSQFGFVPTTGTSTLSTKTAFAYGEWETDKVTVTLNEATEGVIQIGGQAISGGSGSNAKVFFDNITITYRSFLASAKEAWDEAVTAANQAKADCPNVTGEELTALNAELAKAEPTTVDGYNTATEALTTATSALTAAKTNYDALANEIVKATALGMDASSYAATATSTAATALTSTQNLKVAEYNYVSTNYAHGVELGTWTAEGPTGSLSAQHWSGEEHTYLEQSSAAWGQSAWEIKYSQDVTLPAGSYVFKVAGRQEQSNGVTLGLVVKNGDTVIGEENDFPKKGASGLGIDKTGATNFTEADDTYANNNAGYGWEWRYVKFTLDELTTVNVAVNAVATTSHMWVSFCDATVQATNSDVAALIAALSEYDAALATASSTIANETYVNVTGKEKADLQAAIDGDATLDKSSLTAVQAAIEALNTDAFVAAVTSYDALAVAKASEALTKISSNIGTGVFQYNETTNNSLYTAYETAKNAVNSYEVTAESTAAAVQTLVDDLNTAIENYNEQELNAPADGTRYYVKVAKAGHAKEGNALTVALGDTSANNPTGYGINGNFAANANLSQAFIFTKVSGNLYNISIERSEGTVYLTYGSLNGSAAGWNKAQIQATTDDSKKGEFKIVGTETENVFNIYNTEEKANIDCQTGGSIYTDTGITNEDFTVAVASQASVAVEIAANVQYASRMFPFTPTLPTGIVAYSCESADENGVLTLVTVDEPAANVPYILFAENGYSGEALTGWGCGETETKTEGWLTGVYTETAAPAGSYVLQNLESRVAFYRVEEGEGMQPTVGANRAYLTVPAAAGAHEAFFFSENTATGIAAINALTSGNVEIFNAAGAKVPALQKGMNIVKKADGTTYKVMVK